ncbi:MAG: MmcQ/YjbR family DNA-binding protein [Ancrocorticia sp.]
MDGHHLRDIALSRALELPGSELYEFAPEVESVRVRGKWFMVLMELRGQQIVNVKTDPEAGAALRDNYEHILPGYHMNKKHWITLTPGDSLDDALVRELVTESYLLIVSKLPKKQRPIVPRELLTEFEF